MFSPILGQRTVLSCSFGLGSVDEHGFYIQTWRNCPLLDAWIAGAGFHVSTSHGKCQYYAQYRGSEAQYPGGRGIVNLRKTAQCEIRRCKFVQVHFFLCSLLSLQRVLVPVVPGQARADVPGVWYGEYNLEK